MGTKCIVRFFRAERTGNQTTRKCLAAIRHGLDGYPEGVGIDLVNWLLLQFLCNIEYLIPKYIVDVHFDKPSLEISFVAAEADANDLDIEWIYDVVQTDGQYSIIVYADAGLDVWFRGNVEETLAWISAGPYNEDGTVNQKANSQARRRSNRVRTVQQRKLCLELDVEESKRRLDFINEAKKRRKKASFDLFIASQTRPNYAS